MINIDFEIEQDGYKFRDAIILPDNHNLTDAEIDALKQKRFDDWYLIVTTPSEEVIEEQTEEVTE